MKYGAMGGSALSFNHLFMQPIFMDQAFSKTYRYSHLTQSDCLLMDSISDLLATLLKKNDTLFESKRLLAISLDQVIDCLSLEDQKGFHYLLRLLEQASVRELLEISRQVYSKLDLAQLGCDNALKQIDELWKKASESLFEI